MTKEPFMIGSQEVHVIEDKELQSAVAEELAVKSTEAEDNEKLEELLRIKNEEPTQGNN